MRRITAEELFALYWDTLERCGREARQQSDEWIGYNIFEEFIVGVTSFLAPVSLKRLLDHGPIDPRMAKESKTLRALTLQLEGTGQWNVQAFRTSDAWDEIMRLSDQIKKDLRETGRVPDMPRCSGRS